MNALNQSHQNALEWHLNKGCPGLVSVIIPAYNQERFLRRTIESVIEQSYRPIECIIVDDGSTDGTSKVVSEFLRQDLSDFRLIYLHQKNQGAQVARNLGILASTGEYVQMLDGDDLLHQDKVRQQVGFLSSETGSSADVVFGPAQWLVEKGSDFEPGEPIGMEPSGDFLENIIAGQWNPSFAYLCRRSAIETCGSWDKAVRIAQDFEFFLRMACKGTRFLRLEVPTGFYRKHSGPKISNGSKVLRVRTNLGILKFAEKTATASQTLTPARVRALANGFRRNSCMAFGVDWKTWHSSLQEALRICPELVPENRMARWAQRLFGVWIAEALVNIIRPLVKARS